MKLDRIESCFISPSGTFDKIVDDTVAFLVREFMGLHSHAVNGVGYLQPDLAVFLVYSCDKAFKSVDVFIFAYLQSKSRMDVF